MIFFQLSRHCSLGRSSKISSPENSFCCRTSTPFLFFWWFRVREWRNVTGKVFPTKFSFIVNLEQCKQCWNVAGRIENVCGLGLFGQIPYWLPHPVSLVSVSQKELQTSDVSQLETCFQCGSDDVCDFDWNSMVEKIGRGRKKTLLKNISLKYLHWILGWVSIFGHCLPLSRFGSPRHQQFIPNQIQL